jgi:hypothetical protein
MAQFTIYRSTDSSAPVLTGAVGDLVNLLDKCLVTGYGSQSAAGWSKPYTGTNKAAFRQGSGSNQFYLRVQDDAPGAGGAKESRITGYEAMTTVDAGTGPFPTAAQGVGSIAMMVARKSATADATARAWIVVADDRTVYVRVLTGDTGGAYFGFNFGEFYSLVASDSYRCFIVGRSSENSAAVTSENVGALSASISSTTRGNYVARGHTGLGGPVLCTVTGDSSKAPAMTTSLGTVPFTNPADGGIYLAPLWISDPTTTPAFGLRGRQRGLWHFLHPLASVADGDTFSGVGDLAGKTFLMIKSVYDPNGSPGVMVVETSNTLETN